MQSVTEIIYSAAQKPMIAGDAAGNCRTCGAADTIGQPFNQWVKESFTNFDHLKPGAIVCRACLFCFSENHPLMQEKTGRTNLQKFRTYSHFVVDGEWFALTKGEKAKMRELIKLDPEVVVIADSGQKHLAFRARRGCWQFEEQSVLPNAELVEDTVWIIEQMLEIFSKKEIEFGEYLSHRIVKFGLERWRKVEDLLNLRRGSIYFNLAIFLAQKGALGAE